MREWNANAASSASLLVPRLDLLEPQPGRARCPEDSDLMTSRSQQTREFTQHFFQLIRLFVVNHQYSCHDTQSPSLGLWGDMKTTTLELLQGKEGIPHVDAIA